MQAVEAVLVLGVTGRGVPEVAQGRLARFCRANTAVLCCRRFASAVDFSAAGDEFSPWAESLCL
jgi:hypothetical protein